MSPDALGRRDLLKTFGTALAAVSLPAVARAQSTVHLPDKRFKKALKYGMISGKGSVLEKFKLARACGFDGVEMDGRDHEIRDEAAAARDATGLLIPGVVNGAGWKVSFSDPDPEVRKAAIASLRRALEDAKLYGASSVLVIAGVVSKEVAYADAYRRSQEAIRQVVPMAEELKIDLAFENVWNNFLLSPVEMARYIDEYESPRVRAFFDVGNVVRFGWPEHWIRALGKRIAKLDIKEYSRKIQNEQGPWKGFNVELMEGDCDWPAVMQALRDIGYTGWGSAEVTGGGEERLREISTRMDRIFAL